ncbi:hypothetical protein CPB86DRAFT_819506 [Serendipita vermifera]|nr:hypothetical protein CPB86DRAFT_819506 [Serendipita vermifera]
MVAVSEAFNFLKEPDYLIHIFLALAGSTEIELGFDPTIKHVGFRSTVPEGSSSFNDKSDEMKSKLESSCHGQGNELSLAVEERVYHIVVRDEEGDEHTFETLRLLSDHSAMSVRSHGTRVWEVFDIQDPLKARRVLKDTWYKQGKRPEGYIVNDIRSRLQNEPENLRHLPEVLMHGKVRLSDNRMDETFELVHRSVNWTHRRQRAIVVDDSESSFYSPTPPPETENLSAFEDPTYNVVEYPSESDQWDTKDALRCHWRLIYVDPPGIAFSDIKQYDGMLLALIGALKALRAIYSVGYIHRRVSSSNILLKEDGTNGVLIDFEFAQKFSEFRQSAVQEEGFPTGKFFKAVEVSLPTNAFLFIPRRSSKSSSEPKTSRYPVTPWFHNPIHDIESIWWICIWLTLFYTETGILDNGGWKTYRCLFLPDDRIFQDQRFPSLVRGHIFDQVYKQPFFSAYLSDLRDCLEDGYATLQSDLQPVEDRPTYRETFDRFLDIMETMRRSLGLLGQIELQPLRRSTIPLGSL